MYHVQLKQCAHPGCPHEFPLHYFSDVCSDHTTHESDAIADERARSVFARGDAAAIIHVLQSFGGTVRNIERLREAPMHTAD